MVTGDCYTGNHGACRHAQGCHCSCHVSRHEPTVEPVPDSCATCRSPIVQVEGVWYHHSPHGTCPEPVQQDDLQARAIEGRLRCTEDHYLFAHLLAEGQKSWEGTDVAGWLHEQDDLEGKRIRLTITVLEGELHD